MPYIKFDRQREIIINGEAPQTSGELNFAMTQLAIDYLQTKGKCYATINDILGAFDGAAREFYDRIARPYEDIKIAENGDVYACVS